MYFALLKGIDAYVNHYGKKPVCVYLTIEQKRILFKDISYIKEPRPSVREDCFIDGIKIITCETENFKFI